VSQYETFDFRASSSGRYGYLVSEKQVHLPEAPADDTHYYQYFFTVVDTVTNTVTVYQPMTGLYKVRSPHWQRLLLPCRHTTVSTYWTSSGA